MNDKFIKINNNISLYILEINDTNYKKYHNLLIEKIKQVKYKKYSISYKDNIAGIAMSNNEIGFDIEDMTQTWDWKLIMKHFSTNFKVNDNKSFIKFWSKQEACYKLIDDKKNVTNFYSINDKEIKCKQIIKNNKLFTFAFF